LRRSSRSPSARKAGSRASNRQPDRRLRFGGAWFSAATALPLYGDLTRPRRLARFVAAAVRRPRRLVALIALLLRTPREYVPLSASCTGQALDRYFNQRRLGILRNCFCRGVLLLPADHEDYLRGRHRQAVRTNLRRAATAGILCEVVSDTRRAVDDARDALRRQPRRMTDADLHAWTGCVRALVERPDVTLMVARDRHGQTLAIAAAIIDDTVCLIMDAVSTCHEARWALHDYLVRILVARRVKYLLAEGGGVLGALGSTRNIQHYQHLLGYELRHMIPARPCRATRRRRRLASLAAVVASAALILPPVADGDAILNALLSATGTRSHSTRASGPPMAPHSAFRPPR
jgi:hypothetical protein